MHVNTLLSGVGEPEALVSTIDLVAEDIRRLIVLLRILHYKM